MFSPAAQTLVDRAKALAIGGRPPAVGLDSLFAALLGDAVSRSLLASLLGLPESGLPGSLALDAPSVGDRKLPLTPEARDALVRARGYAARVPDPDCPGVVTPAHLCAGVVATLPPRLLPFGADREEGRCLRLLAAAVAHPPVAAPSPPSAVTLETQPRPSLAALALRLRELRQTLEERVHGQEGAVRRLVEGMFAIDAFRAPDATRHAPAGCFVFAGPPGVGKTFLAQSAAAALRRPFQRFDMAGFGQEYEVVSLVGAPPVYKGARPGLLTSFVASHADAILLFDEVEKASPEALQLFLQLLDGGYLEDRYDDKRVDFRRTIVIFTTNAGRLLYDDGALGSVAGRRSAPHQSTVLDALGRDVDARSGRPLFPPPLLSRLAAGAVVLFQRLGVADLARIAADELHRSGEILAAEHGLRLTFAPAVASALVLREGPDADARRVQSHAATFLQEEIFRTCELFRDDRLERAVGEVLEVDLHLDPLHAGELAHTLFDPPSRPCVLFAGDPARTAACAAALPEFDWLPWQDAGALAKHLARHDVDFVLLDPSLRPPAPSLPFAMSALTLDEGTATLHAFDHKPWTARRFVEAQHFLEEIGARAPGLPAFLLAAEATSEEGGAGDVLLAGDRCANLRGSVAAPAPAGVVDWEAIAPALRRIAAALHAERMAADLWRQSQVLHFDIAPLLADRRRLQLRLRNLRAVRAPRAEDAGRLVSGAERPTTRFADVVGAEAAKEALADVCDWLRAPKRFAAARLPAPRGVLLTGPPGTGKTMLARALAGESDCAFLHLAATSFVTIWQGSGPQNVRELFARARRYAPSVVFLDEIDAIGKDRVGGVGAARAEEETLNALLTEMDGFTQDPSRPVVVLAATNHPQLLDKALVRRFSRVVEVELPATAERAAYLERLLAQHEGHAVTPAMCERLAQQSVGLSLADLEHVLTQAAFLALRGSGVLDDGVLNEAFERVVYGRARGAIDAERTARHEAGHALILSLTGRPPVYVTTVGRGAFAGYVASSVDERGMATRGELVDRLCALLGGREAERFYYDGDEGDSTGTASDLAQATSLAEAMVFEYGMAPEVGFVRIDRGKSQPENLLSACHLAVRRLLEAQGERAADLLRRHPSRLDAVTAALLQRGRLLRHELLELVPEARDHFLEESV